MKFKKNYFHVYAYGDISAKDEAGKVSLYSIKDQMDKSGTNKDILIHISSRGGSYLGGFTIYDFLTTCGKNIDTIVDGQCGSIATVVALAGKERFRTENAQYLIHNPSLPPSALSGYTADDYQEALLEIRDAENSLINFYSERTGSDKELISAIMKKDANMPPDQSLELKFVTSIIQTVNPESQVLTLIDFKKEGKPMSKYKEILAALTNLVNVVKRSEIKASVSVSSTEGKTLVIETDAEPKVGDMCTVDGAPAPDGTYTAPDRTVYTVSGGTIASITPLADVTAIVDKEAITAKVKEEVTAEVKAEYEGKITEITSKHEADIESLKASHKKDQDEVVAKLEKFKEQLTALTGGTPPKPGDKNFRSEEDGAARNRVKEYQESKQKPQATA